jgi:hypothetical protein
MQARTLATLALALATMTAGCGFLLGTDALEFAASPVSVSDQAVSETGYQETALTARNVTQNVTVADQRRTVRIVNHLGQYERSVQLPGLEGSEPAAALLALSSPEVNVAGQTLNPIEGLEERELLSRFSSSYEGLSVGQQVDNRSVQVLGADRSVSKYEGTATLAGAELDVYVHVTEFKHGDDFVAVVAIYPQSLRDEEETVRTLLTNLEHATDSSEE